MEDKQYRSGGVEMLEMLEATDQDYKTCDIINGRPCIPCQSTIEMDAQIATATNAIGDTQDVLSRLLKDKHALRAERNQFHDPISRRFPTELISSIFEACVDNREPSSLPRELSYSSCTPHTVSPLILGAVCQEWKRIAWTSSSLWTHIYIRFYERTTSTYVEGVERWLQRSGILPLCIFLEIPGDFLKEANPTLARLIHVIKQYAGQWRSLYIDCYPSLDLNLLFGNLSCTRPPLRNLSIRKKHRHSWNASEHGVEFTELGPSRLRLRNVNLSDINIRWGDMTDIDLVGVIRLHECVKLLQKTPRLVKCRFDVIADPVEGWRTSASLYEHTVHYELRELFLERYCGTDIEMFLQHFSFPNLLHLDLVKFIDPNILSAVTSLLGRSSPPLSSLRIREINFGSSELINLLQTVPSLVKLNIYELANAIPDPQASEANPFLTALVEVFNHHLLLPNLKTIYCKVNREFMWSLAASWESIATLCETLSLQNIIEKRPLTSITIEGGTMYRFGSKLCEDKNLLLRLVKISQSGIDLKVHGVHGGGEDVAGSNLLVRLIDKMKSC